MPLEKDNSEEFRQRELRAAQLAREIESSPQYRLRIAMENDDGRTEEEKHSAVQRQGSGRESPSLASRYCWGWTDLFGAVYGPGPLRALYTPKLHRRVRYRLARSVSQFSGLRMRPRANK